MHQSRSLTHAFSLPPPPTPSLVAPLLRLFGVHMGWLRWPVVVSLFAELLCQVLVFVAMEFLIAELTLMCRVLSPSSVRTGALSLIPPSHPGEGSDMQGKLTQNTTNKESH